MSLQENRLTECQCLFRKVKVTLRNLSLTFSRVSLPIGTNGKPLAAIGKFPSAIGKLTIGKTLATYGEENTNAMIGNDVMTNYS